MKHTLKAVAAATALGLALAAPSWAQTPNNGSPGAAPRVGAGESGPVANPSGPVAGRAATGMANDSTGCDRLTGKTREDCMARRDAAPRSDASPAKKDRPLARKGVNPPLAGTTPGAGASESGPATMERPATANTRDSNASAGGARAPEGADSRRR